MSRPMILTSRDRNGQLGHPLVSPSMAYLGGLPPCLFIASDKELLRDEIIHWQVYPHFPFVRSRLS